MKANFSAPLMLFLLVIGGCQHQRVVYAKHIEPPHYPPLAWQTRIAGTIEMKLEIAADGHVLSVESPPPRPGPAQKVFQLLRESAEQNIKTWTFGCAGCPPNASFDQTIRFNYVQDMTLPERASRIVLDLPDQVTISAGPMYLQWDAH
jgi:hypothetical protein